jgi:VIT1/CCC1 family predicted Fe2+/Mn2+ transporter
MASITARDAQRHAALAHHRAASTRSLASAGADAAEAGRAGSASPARSPRRPRTPAEGDGPTTTTTAPSPSPEEDDEHEHFSHRAPWLRAFVLGANDGLVSVASLMLGVGAAASDLHAMRVSGVAGLVAGALSMAVGEYISVSSQRDAEEADVEKERLEQLKGPEAQAREFEELVGIYMARGLSEPLAREVARELTEKDVIRAHARDELGIDLDEMANPLQASVASAAAFSVGAGVPLLAGAFVPGSAERIGAVVAVTSVMLVLIGGLGAHLGGARIWKGALRVLIGGLLAMGATFGIGAAFGAAPARR